MRSGGLQHGLRGIDWGVATSDNLAAPVPSGAASGVPLGSSGHFHQWREDLRDLLGAAVTTHRMVAGWAHLQPEGPGSWDRAALDRCDRALDALLASGIRPSLTLLHLSLPDWLHASGGWLTRDTAQYFADFAAGMGSRFGDRVARWITSTELMGPSLADCVIGMFPTSRSLGLAGMPAVHHVLLGHGLAVRALRGSGVLGEIGTTVGLPGVYPATEDPWDRLAAERLESWAMRMFLDPLLLGEHMVTEDGVSPVEDTGCVRPGDMALIATQQDLLGLAWYVPHRIAAPENLPRLLPAMGCFRDLNEANRFLMRLGFAVVPFEDVETTAYGWPIIPEALADGIVGLDRLYGELLPPLLIIDNGMGDLDLADREGKIDHARRRALQSARLSWLAWVMEEGVAVRGYEYWSVLDNLEAHLAYGRLYGIAVPDHEPLQQPPIPTDWVRARASRDRAVMTPQTPGLALVHGHGRAVRRV